jgi:hypothetical protein
VEGEVLFIPSQIPAISRKHLPSGFSFSCDHASRISKGRDAKCLEFQKNVSGDEPCNSQFAKKAAIRGMLFAKHFINPL